MKDADATIERLLAGLRDAEPSPGMQRRLLEAMETHPAAASASRWQRRTLPWLLRPAMALLFACVIAFTLKVHHHRDTPPYIRSHATTADVQQATAPESVTQKAPARPQRKTSPVALRPPRTGDDVDCGRGPDRRLPCPAFAVDRSGEAVAAPRPSQRPPGYDLTQPRRTSSAVRESHRTVSAIFCHQSHRDEERK